MIWRWEYTGSVTNWVAPLGENVDEFEKRDGHTSGQACCSPGQWNQCSYLAIKLCGVKPGDIVILAICLRCDCDQFLMKEGPSFIDSEVRYGIWTLGRKLLLEVPLLSCDCCLYGTQQDG